MIIFTFMLLGSTLVASQHVVNPMEFPETTELIMDLFGIIGQSTALKTCVTKVESPLDKAIQFAKDVAEIDDKMKKIEQRVEVTVGIMEMVMMIPYVGQAASVVLEPTVTVLNTINSGIANVEPTVGKFAGLTHQWTDPLKTVKEKVDWVKKIIANFTTVVLVADAKAAAAEGCADSLPVGRSKAIHALEGVSKKIDVFPDGFDKVLGTVNKGCSKVETVLSKLHVLRKRRGIPKLSKIKHALDAILNAFGPLGHFLDKVDHVLHKKFCLLHSIGKLVKVVGEEVVDGAKHLVKGVEHLGKEIAKGAKHFVDEAGQVWEEVEGGVEHALHAVGHGIEHVAHEVGKGVEHVAHEVEKGVEHVGHEISKGAQHLAHEVGKGVEHVAHEVEKGVHHLGHEISKGAQHVAHEVEKGVEHVGHEISKGAQHVAHEVEKGVEHVGHEISKGAQHVGHEISKGAQHVGHEISKGAQHVGHEISKGIHHIGHVFHHIFGRRSVVEKYYIIDGNLYALVDRSVDTRTRRGFDICLSVSDILKGVNYVTGGLMKMAQKLIQGIFHGKSPFHIPGLTSDVLNIKSLFHNLNFSSLLPSIKDLVKLPKLDIEKILELNLKLFEMMLPQCAMALETVWSSCIQDVEASILLEEGNRRPLSPSKQQLFQKINVLS